jgi:hypothetical protein
MRKLKTRTDLPKRTAEYLQELYVRLGLPPLVEKLKQEVLTAEEVKLLNRERLSATALPTNVAAAILHVVVQHRKVSTERALLDLSRRVDLLADGRYESLRRAIGEPVDARDRDVPNWDRAVGELVFRGEIIRRVSPRASNLHPVLDAFQEENWKSRIDSPLPGGKNSRKLREAVRSLNDGLEKIRFFCDGRAEGVQWEEFS